MKVIITDETDEIIVKMLTEEGFYVDYKPGISREELLRIIEEYDVILVRGRTKVDRDLIERGRNLKLIGRIGVGLDNIDVNFAKERGITVINAGDATADSVAELTIGALITFLRKIHIGDELFRRGIWGKKICFGHELNGKTLGIIGFGNIGKRVGRIALAIGMKVIAYDVIKEAVTKSGLDVKYVELEELLKNSDIISIHVPLMPKTRGMIGREEINKMKDGVILVNTARVELFDLDAIYDGLMSGKIGGLIIDSEFKPNDQKIRKIIGLPNVLITPHIGAQTEEAQKKAAIAIAKKVIEFFRKMKISA